MTVGLAPFTNSAVGGVKTAVRTEVRGRGDEAGGCRRLNHPTLLDKRPFQLDAHLEADRSVPVDGDVATSLRLLCAGDIPDQSAALGDHARQLAAAHAAADDAERNAVEML